MLGILLLGSAAPWHSYGRHHRYEPYELDIFYTHNPYNSLFLFLLFQREKMLRIPPVFLAENVTKKGEISKKRPQKCKKIRSSVPFVEK
jgi:hypothetical protein